MYPVGSAIRSVAPGRWAVAPAPGGGQTVIATFPDGFDADVLTAEVSRWARGLASCGCAHLVVPVMMPRETGAPSVSLPVPWRIGRDGLPAECSPKDALEFISRLATVLDEMHAKNIVHGALGLPSVWWTEAGEIVIPDAALAHVLDGIVPANAAAAPYLAPEVLRTGHPVTASDQYSLAVIAYELLTGRAVTTVDSVEGLAAVEPIEIDPMRPLYSGAPRAVGEVLRRALSSAPSARFATCREFADALDGHVKAGPESLPTVHASLADSGVRRRRRLVAVAIAVIGIVTISTIYFVRRPSLSMPSPGEMAARLPSPDRIEIVRSTPGPSPSFRAPSVRRESGTSATASPNPQAPPPTPSGTAASGTGTTSAPAPSGSGTTTSSRPTVVTRDGAGDTRQRSVAAAETGQGRTAGSAVSLPDIRVRPESASRPASVMPRVTGSADSVRAAGTSSATAASNVPIASSPASNATSAAAFVRLDVPRGSTVYVDGVRTAVSGRVLSIPPGRHDIDVVTTSQQSFRRRITATANDTVLVRVSAPR